MCYNSNNKEYAQIYERKQKPMTTAMTCPLPQNFSMQIFIDALLKIYRSEGLEANATPQMNGATVELTKKTSFLGSVCGLGLGLKVSVTVINDTLLIVFSEQKWTDKILCMLFGTMFFFVLFITGFIGALKQDELESGLMENIKRQLLAF